MISRGMGALSIETLDFTGQDLGGGGSGVLTRRPDFSSEDGR